MNLVLRYAFYEINFNRIVLILYLKIERKTMNFFYDPQIWFIEDKNYYLKFVNYWIWALYFEIEI